MKKNKIFDYADAFCSIHQLQNLHHLKATIYSLYPAIYQEKNQIHSKEASIQTLSHKKLRPPLQISFEKDFMKEHTSVFCKSYQILKEFSRISKDSLPKIQALCDIQTRQDLQHPTVSSLLEENQNSLPPQLRKQFVKDLEYEEKLNEFLNIVIENVDQKDALKLILIANKVWMEYVSNEMNEDSLDELIQYGQNLLKTLILPFYKDSFSEELENPEIEPILTDFLGQYVITILLTITEYFENPFYDMISSKGKKRDLKNEELPLQEDGEDFFSSVPTKKRKLTL